MIQSKKMVECGFLKIVFGLMVLVVAALGQEPAPGTGQEQVPYSIPPLETNQEIRADGVMNEEAWKQALQLELNYEHDPGENIPPPVRTTVFLIYGKSHLYVAFYAYDPVPSGIRAHFSDRDAILDDDWVGISLDTSHDRRRMYTFICNPLGIQADMIETNTSQNIEWDSLWTSAGRIAPDGYIVEMAIPFSSLRFKMKEKEQVWGFAATRQYPRNLNHTIGLFLYDRNNFCFTCQIPSIIGFSGAKPGKNIELDPTVSTLFSQERESFPEGKFRKKENRLDPGLTAHWGFTSNMTLSAALNPDFSQVEADAAQLDINTQFALYYPEKRPFFLEGMNVFETRLAAVYTRTLADPDWGIKLTGKEGTHALGFYSARDNITNLLFPGTYGSDGDSLPKGNIGTVLRYRYDLGKISTLGLLVTDREGDDYYNRLAGVDAFLRISGKKHLTAQLLTTQTHYPAEVSDRNHQPQDKFSGTALDVIFRHESRNIGYYASYTQLSPGFRADLGYIPQVGYRDALAAFILASWRNPGHWYTFLNIHPSYEYKWDFDGRMIAKIFKVSSIYTGPAQSLLNLKGYLGKQSYLGNIFNANKIDMYGEVQPSGSLKLSFFGSLGDQVDYDNTRGGKRLLLNPGIDLKIGRHLFLQWGHFFERMRVNQQRLYTAHVSNLKWVWQFNRRAFLRTILEYVHYDYNAANYLFPIDPEFKHLFTQVLFSYKVNPQTVLFLGYSDDRYGFRGIPLTQSNRTLFLKVGYALVL